MTEERQPADLVVVGAGASGLACALAGARLGLGVVVLEKTDRCGHKLALTGGCKGNFTHASPPRELATRFDCPSGRLLPLLKRFPYQAAVELFRGVGVESRVDEDGCVWPIRGGAPGLRDALVAAARGAGAIIQTRTKVESLARGNGGWRIATGDGDWTAGSVCLATGGASYPQTGSTGEGIGLCRKLGVATGGWFPALASLRTAEDFGSLAGVTQPRVRMVLAADGRELCSATGHFIFAHRYVSGSAILNLSGYAARALRGGARVTLGVDWVPDLGREALAELLRDIRTSHPKKKLVNVLVRLVARRLAERLVERAGIPAERRMADLGRGEADRLAVAFKQTELSITGTEPIERATVTGGGVLLDEVDLRTCRVSRADGLYIVGELLDTWAETGGYNLHFAWATGIAAAEAAAEKRPT